MTRQSFRPAWAEIDHAALQANAALLTRLVAPAKLCSVVKADGYGHGALECARAAISGGASMLAVALAEEALALRAGGIGAPILLLSEPPEEAMEAVLAADITPGLYRRQAIELAERTAARIGRRAAVHIKVDTGMHRLGAEPGEAVSLCRLAVESPSLRLGGLWTHLAVADDPDDSFTDVQLDRFEAVVTAVRSAGIDPGILHAANSAAALVRPRSRYDLVRCGIASYGHPPSAKVAALLAERLAPDESLRPALSLKARVHLVRPLAAGERPSYGRTHPLSQSGAVAVVLIGYADGVTRRLAAVGGEVLIGGRRRRLAGTVTMDQIIVDCGSDPVRQGDEVVLIGRQGGEEITAEEWAQRTATIAYEVLCGIGPRVPRFVVGATSGPTPAPGVPASAHQA